MEDGPDIECPTCGTDNWSGGYVNGQIAIEFLSCQRCGTVLERPARSDEPWRLSEPDPQ